MSYPIFVGTNDTVGTSDYIVSVQCPESAHEQCHAKYSLYTRFNEVKPPNITVVTSSQGWISQRSPAVNVTYCPGVAGISVDAACQSRLQRIENRTTVVNSLTESLHMEFTFPTQGRSHVFVTKTNLWAKTLTESVQAPGWRWFDAHTTNPRTLLLSRDNPGFTSGTYVITLMHECDASCAPANQVTTFTYALYATTKPYTSQGVNSTQSQQPLALMDGGGFVTGTATNYYTIPVTDPCDNLEITLSAVSGAVNGVYLSPGATTDHPSQSSWGWVFFPSGASAAAEYVTNTFTLKNGFSVPNVSVAVHCSGTCNYGIRVSKVPANQAVNATSEILAIGAIKWFSLCVSKADKGMRIKAQQLDFNPNITRQMYFFVSKSPLDHPTQLANMSLAGQHVNASAIAVHQNAQDEPFWVSSTQGFNQRVGDASLDICIGSPGFQVGTFYIGVFAMCLERNQTWCFDSLVRASLQASPVETISTIALSNNETSGSVISAGSMARYRVDLESSCMDVSIQLNQMTGSHPFVFVSGERVPLAGPSNLAFSGKDAASILKRDFTETAKTRVNVGILCNSSSECRFGVTATTTIVPSYYQKIGYFHGNYDNSTGVYSAEPKQQAFDVICATHSNLGDVRIERFTSLREYKDFLVVPPIPVKVKDDISIPWEVSVDKRVAGALQTAPSWGPAIGEITGNTFLSPLRLGAQLPGFAAGRYFLSIRTATLSTFTLYRTSVLPTSLQPAQNVSSSTTRSLHLRYHDGDKRMLTVDYHNPVYIKFYLDNICKRIHLKFLTGGTINMFVSSTVLFPDFGALTWYTQFYAGVREYILDASQLEYRTGWYYIAIRCGGTCMWINNEGERIYAPPKPVQVELVTSMLPDSIDIATTSTGISAIDYSSNPDKMYQICVSDPLYGLTVKLKKVETSPSSSGSNFPLLFVARWEDMTTSPRWTSQRSFERSVPFMPDQDTVSISVCSGTVGYEAGNSVPLIIIYLVI